MFGAKEKGDKGQFSHGQCKMFHVISLSTLGMSCELLNGKSAEEEKNTNTVFKFGLF